MGYIEQAYKGKNEWWRYLLSFMLVFLGWQLIGLIPLFLVAFNESQDLGELAASSEHAFSDLGIDSNLYLFAILLMFVFGLLALLFSVKRIHLRSITSLITSRKTIDWNRIVYGFGFWFLLSLIFLSLDYSISPEHYVFNFKLLPFLFLLLISCLLIPLQTSFEELIFRAYLIQGIGVWFKNAMVPFLFTSIAFGLMHAGNPEIEKLGYAILIYYIATGFLFGTITLMDEGAELALGMHAANNIAAALFVTVNWAAIQTEALFIDISEPSLSMYTFLPVFVVYPAVILFFSKKYGWTNWKHKLFGKIQQPSQ